MNNDIYQYEDFSDSLVYKDGKAVAWKDCSNHAIISESSLSRTLEIIRTSSFAILTAYRNTDKNGVKFTKKQNILRNRKLRVILNNMFMRVHQLVGHYKEISHITHKPVDVVERSYLVKKKNGMTDKQFAELIQKCLTIDGETQDGALMSLKSKDNCFYFMTSAMKFKKVGDKVSLGKLGEIYSQHVRKLNVPFVFEGEECPNGGMAGAMLYKSLGYAYGGNLGFGE